MIYDPTYRRLIAEARLHELRRAARHIHPDTSPPGAGIAERAGAAITIRRASPEDGLALARLAALACDAIPSRPLLVAEADGQLQAALSLADGARLAHPFKATAVLFELLSARAAQLQPHDPSPRRRLLRALRPRMADT